ncbi:hypothetical protein LTS10_010706 [Elasticomyces elasticus]|nr:hypothetical protein LTS10_010706 [Elasticomyces elasticus]
MTTNTFAGANTGGSIQAGTFNVAGDFNYHEQADAKNLRSVCLESLYFHDKYAGVESETRLAGNGDWVLTHDAYLAWQSEGGMLVVTGRIGSGKSTLIDHVATPEQRLGSSTCPGDRIAVSFRFRQGRDVHHRPELDMLRSYLHLMLRNDENLLDAFMDATDFLKRCRTQGVPGPKWDWNVVELREPLYKVIGDVSQRGTHVRLYLDGVEESSKAVALRLLDRIRTLSAGSSGTVGICMNLRPQLVHKFEPEFVIDLDRDLAAYVAHHFRSKQTALNPGELAKVKDRLVSQTSSVFQWLIWACPRVVILAEAMESCDYIIAQIQGYPKALGEVYAQQTRDIHKSEVSSALRILEWLTSAKDPLFIDDLRHAVCLEAAQSYSSIEDLRHSKHWCDDKVAFMMRVGRLSGQLVGIANARVKVPGLSGPQYREWHIFQFSHHSVQAFMEDSGLQMLRQRLSTPQSAVPSAQMELSLAERCLAFLMCKEVVQLRVDRTRQQTVASKGVFVTEGKKDEFLPEPPFALHAAEEWVAHFKAAEQGSHSLNTPKLLHDLRGLDWPHIALMYDIAVSSNFMVTTLDEGQTLLHLLSRLGLDSTLTKIFALDEQDPFVSLRKRCVYMLEVQDNWGLTPLAMAAGYGQRRVIDELIKQGANVGSRGNTEATPLHHAAQNGTEDVVERLLACGGVQVDAKDKYNYTPLARAAWPFKERIGAVKLLLRRSKLGVHCKDVSAVEGGQQKGIITPLVNTMLRGSEEMLALLLGSEIIDSTLQGIWGFSILHICLHQAKCAKFILDSSKMQTLIESGRVDVDIRDVDGRSPLAMASANGDADTVRLLLSSGKVQVSSMDKFNKTPLLQAIEGDHVAIARLLVSADGHLMYSDPNYNVPNYPLGMAINAGNLNMVRYLVNALNVNPLRPMTGGISPIGAAMQHHLCADPHLLSDKFDERREILKYLCEYCLKTFVVRISGVARFR